jgi:hypothetical protein
MNNNVTNKNNISVKRLEDYKRFIKQHGVGDNDKISDSVRSYVIYLKRSSKHSSLDINPESLNHQEDIDKFVDKIKLSGVVSTKTINNYKSAMKLYVAMVASD